MQVQEKRKVGGAKTSRSETVTVRLNPELRFLAEVAARKQHRTLSSFIEWAVQEATEGVSPALWDVDEADRFINMAINEPTLLTFEEQRIWKMVKEVWLLSKPPREFSGSLEDRLSFRENWWIFQVACRQKFPPSEAAKVLADEDQELRDKFVLHLIDGVRPGDEDEHPSEPTKINPVARKTKKLKE